MTSRDLVNIVAKEIRISFQRLTIPDDSNHPRDKKGRIKAPKVGHAGTLDPLAEGVLVMGIGGASRLVPYVQQTPKRYEAWFRLGCSSASGDLEQSVIVHDELPKPTFQELKRATASLTGIIQQVPTAFSAIKINGKRAYEMARKGNVVDVPSREIVIHKFDILEFEYPHVRLDIQCGSGTYIRTLGLDLAKACGTQAVMTKLFRTEVGDFHADQSIDLETIRGGELERFIQPASQGLSHLPFVQLNDEQAWRIDNGLYVPESDVLIQDPITTQAESALVKAVPADSVAAYEPGGRLCAIVCRRSGQWCPYRVFHDRL